MEAVDYQHLTEHYKQRTDEEILRLASSVEDLTQDAKNALMEEMKRRGLGEVDLLPYRTQELEQRKKMQAATALRESGFKRAKKLTLIVLAAWTAAVLANILLRKTGASRDAWHPIAIIANILTSGLGLSLMWLLRARLKLWRAQDHLDKFRS